VTHYDGHIHQSPAHIGWNVGVPVAALVPNDRRYVERAVAAQRALLFERRSQAGRALLELADRLYSGNIILPAEVAATTPVVAAAMGTSGDTPRKSGRGGW